MPRRKAGSRGDGKTIIRVFCEGESEQAYTEFLKRHFSDVAVIAYPKETGLFDAAKARFSKDPRYRDYTDTIDEIWFFFDVEKKDIDSWNHRFEIIEYLRKLKRKPYITVRLLMTTGCIEYWLMLHYKMYAPPIQTVAEKERVIGELKRTEPTYEKGDYDSIEKIAINYQTALVHAKMVLGNLLEQGMPNLEESDERNEWLCKKCLTFSNVFEAIEFLEEKASKNHTT